MFEDTKGVIKEAQITQWPKEKRQNDKQRLNRLLSWITI